MQEGRATGVPSACRVHSGVGMAVPSAASPWKLGGLSLTALVRRVWSEIREDAVTERAAALSYYFVFALFPALLFLTALLSLLPIAGLQERLMASAQDMLPPAAATTIQHTLNEIVSHRRTGLLSIGALVTLWASSNGMASVMSTMNAVYGAAESRPWWRQRLLAVALTIAFSVAVVAGLVLLVFGGMIGSAVANWFGLGDIFTVAWNVASVVIVVTFGLVGIQVVYQLAPARERAWRWVTPGAALALGSWLVMSYGLRIWVRHFANYSATYGSIGGVILLMLWFYLTSVVVLVGAEVDSEIEAAARESTGPPAREREERIAA